MNCREVSWCEVCFVVEGPGQLPILGSPMNPTLFQMFEKRSNLRLRRLKSEN